MYNLLSVDAWQTPLGYQGDALFGFGIAKSYMDGQINPILFKFIPTLNAPFIASWNDYPITEDLIFFGIGQLAKFIGLFAAANFALLLAHVLAGLSLWFVCIQLKYRPILAFAGGIVFAFCPYIFTRGLGHITLTYCWHIPLLILVTNWAYQKTPTPWKSRKFLLAVTVAAIGGVLNPYYTGMFFQLLGFSILVHLARKQYTQLLLPLTLIAVGMSAFLVMNANSLLYSQLHGSNAHFAGRNLAALEVYGLKIPELFFPAGYHPWKSLMNFAQANYYVPAYVKGELWSPYLGLVGIAGLLFICISSGYRLLQGRLKQIPVHFWHITWITAYSLIGGLNLMLGVLGFSFFRATNRYSIFILVISLLFLIRFLSRKTPRILHLPIALLLITVALGEYYTPRSPSPSSYKPIAEQVAEDRRVATTVEKQLPGALVFQLPVAGFPEVGPINLMGDYEHFRPFIYTQSLHYSYGTEKGRGDAEWQDDVAKLPAAQMALRLQQMGFSVIMINRKGYKDSARQLISELLALGHSILAENQDLIALHLTPIEHLDPAPTILTYDVGWSTDESTHRWSLKSQADMSFISFRPQNTVYDITFSVSALTPRKISILRDGQVIKTVQVTQPGEVVPVQLSQSFSRGKNTLTFKTDAPPIKAGPTDLRKLSIKIIGIKAARHKPAPAPL